MKFMKLGSKPDSFQTNGNEVRFVATELATDIIVNVGDAKFYLHKFPLLSKSAHLQRLVANTDEENTKDIYILDVPGGSATFELCAKFCYGITVTLNAYNVVAVRCAAEYLEMHENVEKGNLVYKIEVFLNSTIFRSWKDSIIVLQTSKSFLPLSEDLKVIIHCIDSIASKASIDSSKVDWPYTYNKKKLPSEDSLDPNCNGDRKQQFVPKDWWVEDLCELDMDFYKRVIVAIRTKKRMSTQVMGEALKAYTYRRFQGFGKGTMTKGKDVMKNRSLIETIVWLLPAEIGTVSCNFLLRLLRVAALLDCSEMDKKELIRRIGRQLQEASVSDLLIPAPHGHSTYDIDIVLNIVEEFVMQEGNTRIDPQVAEVDQEVRRPAFVLGDSMLAVAKLIEEYLAIIARESNLPLSKFVDLAKMVTGISRPVHDGLYRAIDIYLKEHRGLSKIEKKKICSLMDCKKLSMDACMHAIQNERLPLRVVVQVLFCEQARAIANASEGADLPGSIRSLILQENRGSLGSSCSAATTKTEDDWDRNPTVEDLNTFKSMQLVPVEGTEKICNDSEFNRNSKEKGVFMSKRLLSKFWTVKHSSPDASESPCSVNLVESKLTPSRNLRRSVS